MNVKEKIMDTVSKELMLTFGIYTHYDKIQIHRKAWNKMCNAMLLTQCKGEIGGLLVIDDSNGIVIEDVLFAKQETSFMMVKFDMKHIMQEYSINNPEILPKIKGWWHSHMDLVMMWSSVDESTARGLMDYGMPFCISIVQSYNLLTPGKFNMKVRLDLKNPRIQIENIPHKLIGHANNEIESDTKEINQNAEFAPQEIIPDLEDPLIVPQPKMVNRLGWLGL
jgi:hypothetical protein